MPLNIVTPLIESLPLSQLANTRIWLKMEALQPSGSFKMRGIGYVCEQHYARVQSVSSPHPAVMPAWLWLMPGAGLACRRWWWYRKPPPSALNICSP
ncbi:pyridoxal-phosphate dependent enzyme [Erwinia aphidicola]|uniref:pyridoxal-phosphate dependent enzyme n=1 Tax=Erwinia aphidicola TaxID=68334 RepID=UPI0030D4964F